MALLFGELIWKTAELWPTIRIAGSYLRTHLFLERENKTSIPFRNIQQSPQIRAGPHCLALQHMPEHQSLGGGGVMVIVPLVPGAPPYPSSSPLSGFAHSLAVLVRHICSLLNLESFLDGSVPSLTFYSLYRTDIMSSCYRL